MDNKMHSPLDYSPTAHRLAYPMTQHVTSGTPDNLGMTSVMNQHIVGQTGYYMNYEKGVHLYEGPCMNMDMSKIGDEPVANGGGDSDGGAMDAAALMKSTGSQSHKSR